MYLFPAIADWIFDNDRTHLWMTNLTRGDYQPTLALWGGGIALLLTTTLNVIWYQRFEDRV
ncbi:MAG: hypothetical protein AAF722_12695 [Cyanobacteria bacterium P01_C01_bin.70]